MRRWVDWLLSDRVVMAFITLNATALVLHEMAVRGSAAARLWFWVDYVCVVYFLAEALLKVRRDGWAEYWSSNWNRFDFTVVVLSLPALLGPVLDLQQFAFVLVLRLGRLFRLFRVLRFIPNLDHLVLGVRRALRASVGVFLALLLINLILAVMATLMFRDLDPEHFGNPVVAGYSIFQVFTVEGWNEIANGLEQRALDGEHGNARLLVTGTRLFFVIAVLVGGILGLSLANAVFVDEMMADNTESLERKVDDLAAELRRIRERLGG
ncbi:MAG TPA: ion transporter [Chondromyces sp.]|nr:ion transporter [Chondromyces sp.]